MLAELRPQETIEELKQRLAQFDQLKKLFNQIHSAKDLDELFLDLNQAMLEFFDAAQLVIYAVDREKSEIYTRFRDRQAANAVKPFRLPMRDESIAGFVAKHLVMVNVADVHDGRELAKISPTLRFSSSWDKKTGIHTTQILAVPLLARGGGLSGVIELINKIDGRRFTRDDEVKLTEIAETVGIAFDNHNQQAHKKATKFGHLIASRLITQAELDVAVREAKERRKDIESHLIEKHKIPKREVGKSLSMFYGCPFIEFDERTLIPRDLVKNVNVNYLKTQFWVPLRRHPNAVEVLIDDPLSIAQIQDINRLFPFKEIKFNVGLREDILKYVNSLTGNVEATSSSDTVSSILEDLDLEVVEQPEENALPAINENDSAIVRLANQIIVKAFQMGASDIHVEPNSDKKDTVIRFRIDGVCKEYLRVPAYYRSALASRFKILARLDIAERRKPQDGKIKFRMPDREIELRVATLPTAGERNEDLVMRILAAADPVPLDELKMSEWNLNNFRRILDKPYGLMLCVGPTGAGKTTTLHSALAYLNDPETKIWTAEDPVEITQYGLRQVQVQPRIGFDFAAALRSFLRADPDVIMIGEMRDRETANMAIEASLTGHLVLSTLHTNSAVETVTRLLEMGMDPFNFSDALLGVLAQRLARTLCAECKEQYHPSQEEYDAIAQAYGEEQFARLGISYNDNFMLQRCNGCATCGQSGYRGRIALHELFVASDEVKQLIQDRAKISDLLRVAVSEGMTTLLQDGIAKVLAGWTDLKQVKMVAMK